MRAALLSAAMIATAALCAAPARAVPPTVMPSPGYDARLSEQRRAQQSPPVVIERAPVQRPRPHHRKRPAAR